MLGVLRALSCAGHQVIVATHPRFHARVASLGLTPVPAGMSEEEMLAERLRRWPDSADQPPSMWAPRMFAEIAAPAMAADLEPVLKAWHPDVVLSEQGESGGSQCAIQHGVTFVSHGWGTPLEAAPDNGAAHVDPCPPSMRAATWSGPPRWPVRLETPRLLATNPELTGWLTARQRPLAYVGFGTVPLYRDTPGLVSRTVHALIASGMDALCTLTDLTLEPQLAKIPSDRLRAEPFVSLPDVLPSCVLVVSHGGAGTTLAALAHGLPVVLIPRGAPSQQRMADACTARGVGETIQDDSLDHLPDAIAAVLTGKHAIQARAVAREINEAPHPTRIVTALTQVS